MIDQFLGLLSFLCPFGGFLLGATLLATSSMAQDTDAVSSPIASLHDLVGTWEVVASAPNADGIWQDGPTTTSEVARLLEGQLVQEIVTIALPSVAFTLVVAYSYDRFRDVYRVTATDQAGGLMDVYEGRYENDRLVLTNLRARTFYRFDDGREMAFRLVKYFDGPDRFLIEASMSFDEGSTWQPHSRVQYTRIL